MTKIKKLPSKILEVRCDKPHVVKPGWMCVMKASWSYYRLIICHSITRNAQIKILNTKQQKNFYWTRLFIHNESHRYAMYQCIFTKWKNAFFVCWILLDMWFLFVHSVLSLTIWPFPKKKEDKYTRKKWTVYLLYMYFILKIKAVSAQSIDEAQRSYCKHAALALRVKRRLS